ncbi:hypothetical protein QNH14_12600 [Apirhabdus apintestini]|uniref:hypothetical protein n=1 Tax=Erwinia sp. HR93 TaxID=3094840 RepID=UPI002ADED940|nr:hypothetical protein [Erwinia sp. HR93]MEA1063798.1 hypothetical protein [Erwinia sp. HR93]WPM83959.1 hypothetical protein QNH14_12600 [Enterobacteriaceae bacterium CA-0114]
MLEQLLALKRRRESRQRQQLAAGNQRYERLQNSLHALMEERKQLHISWREVGLQSKGKLARERLHEVQRELESHFQRDRALDDEMVQIHQECEQWQREKAVLQQAIQRSRVEQEKLIYVLEEGQDAYS